MQSFLANRPSLNSSSAVSRATTPAAPAEEGFQSLFARLPECRNGGAAPTAFEMEAEAIAPAALPKGEPKIELVQENGQITRIVVVCGCGDRIELQCQF